MVHDLIIAVVVVVVGGGTAGLVPYLRSRRRSLPPGRQNRALAASAPWSATSATPALPAPARWRRPSRGAPTRRRRRSPRRIEQVPGQARREAAAVGRPAGPAARPAGPLALGLRLGAAQPARPASWTSRPGRRSRTRSSRADMGVGPARSWSSSCDRGQGRRHARPDRGAGAAAGRPDRHDRAGHGPDAARWPGTATGRRSSWSSASTARARPPPAASSPGC